MPNCELIWSLIYVKAFRVFGKFGLSSKTCVELAPGVYFHKMISWFSFSLFCGHFLWGTHPIAHPAWWVMGMSFCVQSLAIISSLLFSCCRCCVILNHVILRVYSSEQGTYFTKSLWAHNPKFGKDMLPLYEIWWSYHTAILHMSWQLSCCEMYQTVTTLSH